MIKPSPANIWCVGRNYKEHAQELGNPIPQEPLFFLKAGSCVNTTPQITLPSWTSLIHYECELVLQLEADGTPSAIGLALDLTARDIQAELKEKRSPWTLAKSFTGACPVSPLLPIGSIDIESLEFLFIKNGQIAQQGRPTDMIFPIKSLLSFLTRHFPIVQNDLLLTGTPHGVGPLQKGDSLQGIIRDKTGHQVLNTTWDVN